MQHPHGRLWLSLLLLLFLNTACATSKAPSLTSADYSTRQLVLDITDDGLYSVPLAALQDAGLETAQLDADQLRLSQSGEVIPYLVAGDTLLFWGVAADSRYSQIRPYVLESGSAGRLMEMAEPVDEMPLAIDSATTTVRAEDNLRYEPQSLSEENSDPWFWHKLGRGQTAEIPLETPGTLDGSGQLTLRFWGETHSAEVEDDHDVDLLVNGVPIETIRWDGNVIHVAQIDLPAGTLNDESNVITLSNEAQGAAFLDIMLLDRLSLAYPVELRAQDNRLSLQTGQPATLSLAGFASQPIALDISNPSAPKYIEVSPASGARWQLVSEGHAPLALASRVAAAAPAQIRLARQSQWTDDTNQADLIIIGSDELLTAVPPLVAAREAQGLSVAPVSLAEIYDAFGHGEASPDSINQFISFALDEWQDPKPRYLLLLGEATTDYHGNVTPPPDNHLPAYLVPVAFSGETVSDSRLADVDGDLAPDLAIGRWPVDTPQAVADLVARTLAYEAGTAAGSTLFATDASEARFAEIAQRLWQDSELDRATVNHLDGAGEAEVTSAWNQGNWLATYIGHGSLELWGKDNLLSTDSVADLGGGNPPIVVQLTCLTGLFAQPDTEALAEVMLQDESGPVLVIAATSLTLSTHQEPFAATLLSDINDPSVLRIGDAFQNAKRTLDTDGNPGLQEISDTFVLLGDPAALIMRPTPPAESGAP